jgi:hypothetical protein
MRSFREILIELADKLEATVGKAPVTPPAKKPTPSKGFKSGKTVIGTAFLEGQNFDLFINKTSEGSYLYQNGYSHEAPIGRVKEFLSQDFVTINGNISGITEELAYQKEKTGGFWFNEVAPKLPVGY